MSESTRNESNPGKALLTNEIPKGVRPGTPGTVQADRAGVPTRLEATQPMIMVEGDLS
jgi:hypothetical protein